MADLSVQIELSRGNDIPILTAMGDSPANPYAVYLCVAMPFRNEYYRSLEAAKSVNEELIHAISQDELDFRDLLPQPFEADIFENAYRNALDAPAGEDTDDADFACFSWHIAYRPDQSRECMNTVIISEASGYVFMTFSEDRDPGPDYFRFSNIGGLSFLRAYRDLLRESHENSNHQNQEIVK